MSCKEWNDENSNYLRNFTTQYDMKIRMKSESAMKSLLPRCAAAVDHADTELIGHAGQLETPGFFVMK